MSEKNVVLLSWDEPSKAYEALAKFGGLSSDGVQVDAAVVVERAKDGQVRVTDGQDNEVGLGTLSGSSIGALVGILGGPLGMLLGFAGGALIGSSVDLDRSVGAEDVIGEMSQALAPGRAGVVAEVDENSPDAIDAFARETGAQLLRRSVDEVLDELAAAEAAADAAAQAARDKVREEKKAERKEKREELVAKIKAKL